MKSYQKNERANTRVGWFLVIGALTVLVGSFWAYFFLLAGDSATIASRNQSVVLQNTLHKYSIANSAAPAAPASSIPHSSSEPSPDYRYNAQGQLQTIIYADGSVYLYQYNAQGDKIHETTRTGQSWTYVYDQNHHPVSIIDPDGRITHPLTPAIRPMEIEPDLPRRNDRKLFDSSVGGGLDS